MDSGPGPSVQSITEQTDLDDFLATAELAGTEFAAGKSYLYSCTPAPVNGGGGGGGRGVDFLVGLCVCNCGALLSLH